jgi:hypothetical protein
MPSQGVNSGASPDEATKWPCGLMANSTACRLKSGNFEGASPFRATIYGK